MDKEYISIAIDGPASAGKSTIAKKVADKLKITYIDTGAMYRAITYKIKNNKIDINNENQLLNLITNTEIDFKDNQIFLDGKNINEEIRSNEISKLVSNIATNGLIREKMLVIQRKIAENSSVVMDGRDIGTVVLPNANLKVFLTASSQVRAERRYKELVKKGEKNISVAQIKKEIEIRDSKDSNRKIAPLKASIDAHVLDNSELTIEESVDEIISLIEDEKNVI